MLSALHREIFSLPEHLESQLETLQQAARDLIDLLPRTDYRQVLLTGCGDSHHAALGAALAFQRLARIQARAATSMQFARYDVGAFAGGRGNAILVVGISASGQVSRTIEALRLARATGADTVAITGAAESPLAQQAAYCLPAPSPQLQAGDEPPVPGARSYLTSLLALYALAIEMGRGRGNLSSGNAQAQLDTLRECATLLSRTIEVNDPLASRAADAWHGADHFVFCGSGPNYGAALYAAAKILEASGEPAVGQDLEEWAHLQYFGAQAATPTILIGAGDQARDGDRLSEVITAATTIGRQVAVIAPEGSRAAGGSEEALVLPYAAAVEEHFSPLLTCAAPLLLASHRARLTAESYFRAFSGGRSAEEGGGISRIRTSHQINRPRT